MIQKKRLVIFDLDNTILNGDSDYSMVNYLISKNILPESPIKTEARGRLNAKKPSVTPIKTNIKYEKNIDFIINDFLA